MPKKKAEKKEAIETTEPIEAVEEVVVDTGPTEKVQLEALYQEMKDRGFNSIGDIENKSARL